MKTLFCIVALAVCGAIFLGSCSNNKKTSLIDKDGNVHILTREGGRTKDSGPSKIIVHGNDTVVTIDDTGRRKIWISADATKIDTTKIQFYLKKRNGTKVNIYLPSAVDQNYEDNIG